MYRLLITKIKKKRLKLIQKYYLNRPIVRNRILFISNLGKNYGCNPKYLCEYLANNYGGEFSLAWVYDIESGRPEDIPECVDLIPFFSIAYLREVSTDGVIVSNTRIPEWFRFYKRVGQVYLQTWHSSLRLKMVEGDAKLGEEYIHNAKNDSKKIDYILSGCEKSSEIIKRAFWYEGAILEYGTPRIDYLINQNKNLSEILLNKMRLRKEYRYVLYAPTFREGDCLDAYNVNFELLLEGLEKRFGSRWLVLYRLHPNQAGRISMEDLPDCCIDMTLYPDMQELLMVSDVLVTDYSSSMFDFAYLQKMCILYMSDYDNYIKKERQTYFNIEELPFVKAFNNEQLFNSILRYDKKEYLDKVNVFLKSIGSFEDGQACARIVKVLLNKIKE